MEADAVSETNLVKACIEFLNSQGWFVWRVNSGAMVVEGQGKRRFMRFNGAKGCSDIIGMRRIDSIAGTVAQFVAIECKIGRNKPTPDQAAFLRAVERRGGLALVVYSIDDLIRFVTRHGQ